MKLNHSAFSKAVATMGDYIIEEDLKNTELTSSNLLYNEQSQ